MKKFTAKRIFIFSIIILGLLLTLSVASAQGVDGLNSNFGEQSGLATANLQVVVARIINAFLGILGLVAVGIILYGGFLYMTARGEAEKVQKAKKLLIQATIGLLIIASAFMITTFILYTLGYYGGSGGNRNIIPPPCSGCACTGTCPPCLGCDADCTDPAPGSGAPYICNVRPSRQAVGGVLTIYGKDLGIYTAGSSKVFFVKDGDLTNTKIEGTILSCGESGPRRWNIDNDGVIKVEVPAALTFAATGNNDYKVFVQNDGKTSVDNPLDLVKLRNIFTLTNDPPSPEIICFDPNFGAEGFTPVKVIGKFLGSQTDNKLVFNKNVAATAITSWTNDLITATVPAGATHGNVYIAKNTPVATKLSDGLNFWVTCSQTTSPYDCASNCCRKIDTYLTSVCDLQKYCGSRGIGASCNGNTVAGGACAPQACDVGVCDSSNCVCREPKVGDSCSSSTTACVVDQAICGDAMVCDSSCKCQTAPVITAVTPDNGAAGNYITISGKGFGQPVLGNNVIPNSDFSTSAVNFFQASQPQNVPPEPPSVLMATISDGQVIIDVSKASLRSWYAMFGYRNVGSLLSNKTINTRYLLSFKYKGNIPVAISMGAAVNFGDNLPNITGDHTRSIGAPIPVGNYTDWQTFQGVFTYDANMKEQFYYCLDAAGAIDRPCAALKACLVDHPSNADNACGKFKYYKFDLGFIQNPFNRDMKMYIDDFEVRELKSIGTVSFCGVDTNGDNNKCGDDGDLTAKLPFEVNNSCVFEDNWQDNEIIVVAPIGGTTGPIKVTTAEGLSAQTAPPAISDFNFNGPKRPSLCGLSTNQPVVYTYINAIGNNFGTVAGGTTGGFVYLGNPNDKKTFNSPGVWTDQKIYNLLVPNLKSGTVPVWVKVGGEISNPVSIRVLSTSSKTTIDNVSPAQGPTGQYVTIQGSGFGKVAGTVKFKAGTSATDPKDWAVGDSDFPTACSTKYWSDTQIIIKVPSGADIDPTNGGLVVIPKGSTLASNKVKFSRCALNAGSCQLTAGICSIDPSQAPIGTSNVVIYGDNFGATQGASKVVFFDGKEPALSPVIAWQDKQIGVKSPAGQIIVPEGTLSGPVIVRDANGNSSNKINFEVADCRTKPEICTDSTAPCCQQTGACTSQCQSATGTSCEYKYTFKTAPAVISSGAPTVNENYNCDNDVNQSPSPWKNPTNAKDFACVNSEIYASFSMPMDPATLTADNIVVKKCAGDPLVCDADVALGAVTATAADGLYTDFSVAPSSSFSPSTWYQVTLKDNITSAPSVGGKKLDGDNVGGAGGNYVWKFKTGDSAADCQVDSANVTPNKALITKRTQTQIYVGRARAANCNILTSNAFNWTWYKRYCAEPIELSDPLDPNSMCVRSLVREAAQNTNLLGLAKISVDANAITGKVLGLQTATPISQGTVYIGAEVDNKNDDANVLNINLNEPIISDFTPKDGLINDQSNSYVTIIGQNFGASQGSSKVSFEKGTCAAGETSPCWSEAKLANCGQAWSNTMVKVIVPKDVKDGAKIKIQTAFGSDDSGDQLFHKSANLYPFLCQLNPGSGSEGTTVTASGDNLGDKNKIVYKTKEYGVGSFVKFQITPTTVDILPNNQITSWSNTSITYKNSLTNLTVPDTKVSVAITPYSEPYNDLNNDGAFTPCAAGQTPSPTTCDEYADLDLPSGAPGNGQYDTRPDGTAYPQFDSNYLIFSQAPIITSLSPDNGPVKQWVTIKGRNFGTYDSAKSKIYFVVTATDTLPTATLAPCAVATWTNSYIIAVAPEGLNLNTSYFVYITTQGGVDSNKDKKFTVNNKPLGAGLCALYDPVCLADTAKTMSDCLKLDGAIEDAIGAAGVRFDNAQGENNLVFSKNIFATINSTDWNENDIKTTISSGTETGDVAVIKKMDTGERKCTGFAIGPWCSTGKYDTVYLDVPSNGLPLEIILTENQNDSCNTDNDCKKPIQVTDPDTGEITSNNICPDSVCVANRCTPEIISMAPLAGPVGQWVDIEGCYLGCKQGKVKFGAVQALVPSDSKGKCSNNWTCSTDLTNGYDLVTVEVPNKTTPTTADDALLGPGLVKLETSKGKILNAGTFTVNTDTSGLDNQVCKVETCGNKVLDTGEKCDLSGSTPPYLFAAGYDTCSSFAHAPANCTLACNANCQPLICDQAGVCTVASLCGNGKVDRIDATNVEACDGNDFGWLNGKDCSFLGAGTGNFSCSNKCQLDLSGCSLAALCGNQKIDGICSNDQITDKTICITTSKYTWNGTACSNQKYTSQATCLAVKNTWTSEQCEIKNTTPVTYEFDASETCAKYGAPADCTTKCNTSCKTLVCNKAGEDCTEPALCGNNEIDGSCKDNPLLTTPLACLSAKKTWLGEQCDCGLSSCSDPSYLTKVDCLANGKIWNWDCTGKLPACAELNYGDGNLGCNATSCKFNTSACTDAPDTTPPFVERTSPVNNDDKFCRNGIIDIYFNELIDPATLIKPNFILGSCTGANLMVKNDSVLARIADYFKNIFFKLIGYKTKALAQTIDCSNATLFAEKDFKVNYANIANTWNDTTNSCSDPAISAKLDCHAKTVAYIELTPNASFPSGLFPAGTRIDLAILPGVKDLAGNNMAVTINAIIGNNPAKDYAYAFGFNTASAPNNGICDADQLKIFVYHKIYTSENNRSADPYVDYEAVPVLNKYDLFRCAGDNNCALAAVTDEATGKESVPADYDQDNKTAGNQHIYSAKAFYTGNGQNYHLSMTYRWLRSSASDPANMLQLSNPVEDTEADKNIVRNSSGVAYVTALPQKDKENTSLLIVDAQARASSSNPIYKVFKVKYFDCAYPWYFEQDDYGNSYIWYCRDKEPLLPDAGKIQTK